MQNTYNIVLPQFEGPFDLLLFFIERDELDIHDIPISKITSEFLEYIRQAEEMNIDLASEFILVAATLMRIKAKLLLPRKEIDEEGNEIDPRDELVQRLLEYKRYKSVLTQFRDLELTRSEREERGNTNSELKKIAETALVDMELESVTLFKLMKTFERVMQRMEESKNKTIHKVYTYAYTIRDQQIFIINLLRKGEQKEFTEIFGGCKDRMHAVITFLGLLELLNMQKVAMIDRPGTNNFFLERKEGGESYQALDEAIEKGEATQDGENSSEEE